MSGLRRIASRRWPALPRSPGPAALLAWLLSVLGAGVPLLGGSGDGASEPEGAEHQAVEEEAESPAYTNTIRWVTASEVDNFGFDVYRGDSEDGPFEKLNPAVIEGGGTTDEPRSYEFVDDTIDPRKTYYYYVESISMSGVRELFTPVGRAPPKIPPETDGEASEEVEGEPDEPAAASDPQQG